MDYQPKYDKETEEDLIKQQNETLKQNALFNLDFDEYKRQVRNETKLLQDKLSQMDYIRNPTEIMNTGRNNVYLMAGIILIVVAFILMLLS
jgi:hypothetical protein